MALNVLLQLNNKFYIPAVHFAKNRSTVLEDWAIVPALQISLAKDIKQSQVKDMTETWAEKGSALTMCFL